MLQRNSLVLLAVFTVFVQLELGECGGRTTANETCSLPPETGPCKALIERWFYNSTTESCEIFTYGGCGGNTNNFQSENDCLQFCRSADTCSLPMDAGTCYAYMPRWFFNETSQRCESFIYGGCKGNANNFLSEADCSKRCICSLPSEVGPCRGAITRWYLNWRTKCCERFSYGGCDGNANNFLTQADCQEVCPQKRKTCQ